MTYWNTITSGILFASLALTACSGGGNPVEGITELFPPPSGVNNNPATIGDVVYKQAPTENGDVPLELDIYQPTSACNQNRPTILYVHGGTYVGLGGTRDWQPIPEMARAANRRDMNFVVIDYRAIAHEPVLESEYRAMSDDLIALNSFLPDIGDIPIAAVADTVSALNWMQTNANTYCFDMSRLAFWGDEAGAITVLQTAYSLNQYGIMAPEPDVVVSYGGALPRPSDLEFREAPLLIFNGRDSELVPYNLAEQLAAQADTAGVPFSFYTLDSHGQLLPRAPFNIDINGRSLLTITLDFIEAHLFGGMPTYETEVDPN